MKILQLIDIYETGGAEKVFDAFNKFCKSHDYINDIYSVYKSKNASLLNFFIEDNSPNLIKKAKHQIQASVALGRILNINRYDRVVSFLDRANLIAILACKKCKIPITVTVHNPPTVQYKKIGFMKNIVFILLKYFYNKNYVKVVAVSKQVKNSLLSIGIHKTTIVYNPIEIDEKKLQIRFNEFGYFLAIGRLNYQKGFWKLIKAIRILKNEYHKNPKLIILGEGEQKDKLKSLIKNMKLESNIKLGS